MTDKIPASNPTIDKFSYEQAYEQLVASAARLEEGNLTLDESLKLYEEGITLARHCQTLLNTAELRVTQLNPTLDTFATPSYDDDDEDADDEQGTLF